MENDLISRSALLTVPNVRKVTEFDETGEGITYLAVPVDAIEKAPIVDAEPVRHGEWVKCMTYDEDGYYNIEYKCSECGRYEPLKQPYCHCGAKMDGGADRGNCPYHNLGGGMKCIPAMSADALAYIKQLEREREALLDALKKADVYGECANCCHRDSAPADCDCECGSCKRNCRCRECRDGDKWEWSGVKMDESQESE